MYHLPPAEYNYSAHVSIGQVLELAKKAATRTERKFGILVTKSDGGREWYNLIEKKINRILSHTPY